MIWDTIKVYKCWSLLNIFLLIIVPLLNPYANAFTEQAVRRRFSRQVSFKPVGNSKSAFAPSSASRLPRITSLDLARHLDRAITVVDKRLNTDEVNIYKNGVVLEPGSPAWFAAASAKTKVVAKNISRIALVSEEATRSLAKQFNLKRDQIIRFLPTVDVRGTILEQNCPVTVDFPCRPKKYRAYSGYCNNVQNPRWGNANTAYVRYLNPDYSDSIVNPRQSITGRELPPARQVSLAVHSDLERPHPHLTVFLAIFAEFIFHDIFHTSQHAGYRGHRIKCCGPPSHLVHPECYPIREGAKPSFCVNYVRSSNVPRAGCTLGPREQINQVTSFLDGSVIYGSSEEEVRRLRTYEKGLLKVQGNLNLLPADTWNPHDCRSVNKKTCFLAGDVRVNENVGLMVMHTIWVREHNRIAKELSSVNPQWNDEQLFEETRRIVGAELQHVTFSELLPALLGTQVLTQFDLEPNKDGFYNGYDINLNPGTSNAFASAVGASFYSMMPSHFFLYNQSSGSRLAPKHDTVGSMQISETHFLPDALYNKEALEQFLLGMMNQRAQSMDEFITREMNNNLFDDKDRDSVESGYMDLAAWIIQQGRDHGIPAYVEWRRVCRLTPSILNFTDLRLVMTAGAAEEISKVYADVRDIDLFTGGLSEKPLIGGVVGPTFACILSRQFQHLKKGDRFWYENDVPPNAFSADQLREIRKVSLSRIICDNAGKLIRLLQPSPLLMPDQYLNAFQNCSEAKPSMDLTKWKTVSPVYEVPKETLLTSLKEAMRQAKKRIEAEQKIFNNNIGVADYRSAQAVHHVFLRPKRQAMLIANKSLVLELASRQFMQETQIRDHERKPSDQEISNMMLALSTQDVEDYLLQEMRAQSEHPSIDGRCKPEEEINTLPCDHTTPYRTSSGWCNNLQNPTWGKSLVTFQRLLPPRYQDGVSSPRSLGKSGRPLPSPRLISSTVHYDTESPHERYSLALMQWGQFIDHDITLTPMHEALDRKPLDCKSCDSASTVHPECLPIPIPPNDPYFPPVHQNSSKNCISFARSLAGQLTLGRREQMDQVTSYIDASNMYGSDVCEARMLRASHGGRLNSTKHPLGGKELLPQDLTNVECRAPSRICFESGDIRASEQPGLTSMHTIWMREHNRLAHEMAEMNPRWNDETIYQEVRRIISAMMQHITYTDFLPRLLGEKMIKESSLSENFQYDPSCDATIFNEFSTAAYRLGHTLLKPMLKRMTSGYKISSAKKSIRLRTAFFNPDVLYERYAIDEVLRGLLSSSVEVFDHSITSEVTNHLFEDSRVPFSGMDLVSLNIQRGRDHGLASYNEYRALCNRTRAKDFDDLRDDIPEGIVQRLRAVYDSVEVFDHSITSEVTNHLFEDSRVPFSGMDLVSLNIQRGRDHGLAPYNEYRSLCNRTRAQDFDDLKDDILEGIVQRLRAVYEHVDDIDLFTGGITEMPMYGALVGPTFGCIISKQFVYLRKCDRFWYETQDPFLRFTKDQLKEIRKTNLAKVICDNSDSIVSVQMKAFDLPDDFLNPRMACKNLPSINLDHWKDRNSCEKTTDVGRRMTIPMGHSDRISPCVTCSCTKEGMVCQSLKISNCFSLAATYTRELILKDDVCKVQCAFAFRTYSQFEANFENVLGFTIDSK